MRFYAAPMEGITSRLYRQLHRQHFPGAARYYTPFFSPTRECSFTPRDLSELLPAPGEAPEAVPQLLVNNAEAFLRAAAELKAMGYEEVNLNVGCCSRTVTAKGKGAGLLADPTALERLLDGIFSAADVRISVKTRLGVRDYDEFSSILELYGRYPIAELIVHARLLEDQYRRSAAPEALSARLLPLRAPLCYNGDVASPASLSMVCALLPQAQAVMLGRGLLRDPGLIEVLSGRPQPEKARYRAFHDALFEAWGQRFSGERALVCHMKELCSYMADLFVGSEKAAKRIRKAVTAADYRAAAAELFALPLKEYDTQRSHAE